MSRFWAGVLMRLLLAALLASCSSPPPLPPPPPPPPAVSAPPPAVSPKIKTVAALAAMQSAYGDARSRLQTYLAQPRCAPSGALACFDPAEAHRATAAEREARMALENARHSKVALRLAKSRVDVFQAVVNNLPIGDATP